MKVGDVVVVKGGGSPLMTVESLSQTSNRVNCVWFVEDAGPFYAQFAEGVLAFSKE